VWYGVVEVDARRGSAAFAAEPHLDAGVGNVAYVIFADSSLGMCTPPSMMNTGAFASLKRTQSLLQYEGMAGGAPRLTARACIACAASAAIASDKCGGGGRRRAPSIAVQVTSAAKAAKSRSAEQKCK
jgi:uncharacterized Ntn-hydrolase superfamily protein